MSQSTVKRGNGNFGKSKQELKCDNLGEWELRRGKGGVKVR